MSDLDPAGPEEQLAKDVSYSPGSERETRAKQADADAGGLKPGTGGPDDNGAVPVQGEVHIPRDSGAH